MMRGKFITFRRDERGIVAVEFSLLALPFFIILVGMIEIALYFTSGVVLEGASAEAARLIRTGQAQQAADPEAMFRDKLCEMSDVFLDCSKLQYEVINVEEGTFAGASASGGPVLDDDGNLIPGGFSPGDSNDVIMVRAAYRYDFLIPYMAPLMSGDPDRNWAVLLSTVVIRSEPYNFGEN